MPRPHTLLPPGFQQRNYTDDGLRNPSGYGGGSSYTKPISVVPTNIIRFKEPAVQQFATSADSGQDHIWGFQESSGNVLDLVGSDPMVPEGSPQQNQTAMIWQGDWTSRKAGESVVEAGAEGFAIASSSEVDPGTANSIAVQIDFSAASNTGTRTLFEKQDAAFGAGFEAILLANGSIQVTAKNDLAAVVGPLPITGPYNDGANHRVRFAINFTAGTISLEGDLDSRVTAAGLASDYTSTEPLELLGAGQRGAPLNCQVTQVETWGGAAAESIDGASLDWTLGSDPNTGDNALTALTHGSAASFVVEDDPTLGELVAHYTGGQGHGVDQVPIRQMPDGAGMGLACWNAHTNILRWSEDFQGNWTESAGANATGQSFDGPDGTMRATWLEGTFGATDSIELTETVTGLAQYTGSVWMRLKDTASATIRIAIRDSTNPVLNHNASVTDEWQRFPVTWTHSADTTLNFKILAGDGASVQEDVYIWGAQVVAGPYAGAYAPTYGSASSSLGHVAQHSSGIPLQAAEIQTDWSIDALVGAAQFIIDSQSFDRRPHNLSSAGIIAFAPRDSVPALIATVTASTATAQQATTTKIAWDPGAGFAGGTSVFLGDGAVTDVDGASFTIGTADDLFLGGQSGLADVASLEGAISEIRIYDEPVTP